MIGTSWVSRVPSVKQSNKLVLYLGTQVLGSEAPRQSDDGSHLVEVLGATRTAAQVGFEPAAVACRQRVFEVGRDELDDLLAREANDDESRVLDLPELSLEGCAHSASTSVQYNALIGLGDVQQIADFGAVHSLEITECHHAALLDGELIERGPDGRRQFSSLNSLVQIIAPVFGRQ